MAALATRPLLILAGETGRSDAPNHLKLSLLGFAPPENGWLAEGMASEEKEHMVQETPNDKYQTSHLATPHSSQGVARSERQRSCEKRLEHTLGPLLATSEPKGNPLGHEFP